MPDYNGIHALVQAGIVLLLLFCVLLGVLSIGSFFVDLIRSVLAGVAV